MNFVGKHAKTARQLLILFLFAGITACGGERGSSASPPVGSSPPPPPGSSPQDPGEEIIDNRIIGSVGDGPVIGAELRFYNKHGDLLNSDFSDQTAGYNVTIREKGKNYPIRLVATKGLDLVTFFEPDFEMVSVILKASRNSHGNLNPHSTFMVKIAERLGGLNDVNYVNARTTVMNRLNFGLNTQLIPDPVDIAVDDITAPMIVKASETMGEMVRRTRDALAGTGVNSGDAVIDALAADLVDGVLDGRGANGTNARVSAVATLTSAQVLTEAMVNKLHVYGIDASGRMMDAIATIRPSAERNLRIAVSDEMIAQTTLAVDAAWVLTQAPALDDLRWALRSIPADSNPWPLRQLLPDATTELSTAVDTAVYGSSADVELVNSTVRLGQVAGPEPDPEIGFSVSQHQVSEGGQVAIQVERTNGNGPAWVDYEFVAGSATADVDYASTPGRLSFADGQLAKYITVTTLQDNEVENAETLELHLVAVSDGVLLNVNSVATVTIADDDEVAPTVGSATLRWTPPTEREDGSVLDNLAGYKVHYGTSQSNLGTVVVLDNPGLSSYVVDNLGQGTWYFAVTAYDADGRESSFSNVGSKMIL